MGTAEGWDHDPRHGPDSRIARWRRSAGSSSELKYSEGANRPRAFCCRRAYNDGVRVAIDARKLTDFGIGTYLCSLLRGMEDRRDVELSVVARPGHEGRVSQLAPSAKVLTATARGYSLAEHLQMPATLWREARGCGAHPALCGARPLAAAHRDHGPRCHPAVLSAQGTRRAWPSSIFGWFCARPSGDRES